MELVIKIKDLSRGGSGVGRSEEGQAVFVPFTVPGDLVRIQIEKKEKRYLLASLLEILEPSPDRQTPRCKVFGRCGGCQWQNVPYATQWKTKSIGALHALNRVGIDTTNIPIDEWPAEIHWNYRNRIQLRGYKNEIGFFAPKSNDLVPIDRCEIADEKINDDLKSCLTKGAELSEPYKLEIGLNTEGKIVRAWNSRHAAKGFRQIHDAQNQNLRKWVASQLKETGQLYDLYGGSGNLSELLLSQFNKIDCVDVDAKYTKKSSEPHPKNLRFCKESVSFWAKKQRGGNRSKSSLNLPSSAIIDPPREGLGPDFISIASALEFLGVKELIAVGCDPDNWSKDVTAFLKRGWKLKKIATFDFFPQTIHVESAALLHFGLL